MGIKRGVKITASVPLKLVGEAIGTKTGGILENLVREIEVECLPRHLPESLEIDISHMDIGDSLHIWDLEYENIKILTKSETGILNVIVPKVVAVAAEMAEEEVVVEEEEVKPEEKEVEKKSEQES